MKYRPDECLECGFVWGEFQGRKYGTGYETLAANVWKCTRCEHTVRSSPTNGKRIAKL